MSNRFVVAFLALLLMLGVCMIGAGLGAFIVTQSPEALAMLAASNIEPTLPAPSPTATAPPSSTPIPTKKPTARASSSPEPSPTPAVIDPEDRLIHLYEVVAPAVVNITTQIMRQDFFWGVTPESGSGSGFVWDEQGHILTNYHVIEGAQHIDVSFSEDLVLPAEVVGADPPNDLAVLKVEEIPKGVMPLPLGDSDALRVGQVAVAIGNPFGQFRRTLTAGVISALDRTINVSEDRVLRGMIQTDADINRGNSGGPLLDSSGRVIGVTSAIFSPTGANAGVGLAIPINKAKRVAPVLIEEGRYLHPWLGIEQLGYVITPRFARALNLPVDSGLLIARIYRHSPANRAGIRPATKEVLLGNRRYYIGGDILVAIDGVPLKTWEDLDAYLQERVEVGDIVTLTIIRDDETMHVEVEVDAEPMR